MVRKRTRCSEPDEQGPCMTVSLFSNPGAVTIDANVMIAISSREAGRDAAATTELSRYASIGYEWFAPGTIVSETLYILCGKHSSGILTTADYAASVQTFARIMSSVLSPPSGEAALILRAEHIGSGYGCSRSADGIYIALAEQLAQTRPSILLTFDKGLPKQATRHAPTVQVHLL
jgi:predicted nucleic acid-binding protein